MWLNAAVGAFIGAVLSLFVSILIENQRKPKVTMEIEDYYFDNNLQGKPAKIIKVLRVKLLNRKVKDAFSWWLNREALIHCNATIQILHTEDRSPLFTNPIHARWTRSDEPYTLHRDSETKQYIPAFDIAKYNAVMSRTCYPGTEEIIDVVTRYDNEEDCYIWNNDIYYKGWRNTDVRIPKGRYYVIVTVSSSGENNIGYFKLENTLSINDFRLLNVSNEELKILKKV
ncbi:MAG: hypothetical protein WA116_05570 [Anaerolineaceae bacterium]